ncbi:MucB/RseB C-terminal domain-containing protein [Rhodoferax mekongensis]|uniref:MucB/RseB C-terminal domain-containing protein n=1 Tax=Rhodoferax mekongensis TaxID=3068341 RepID=UPI0028BD8AE6|nr:MucB/RseB C-terminal domain-containing protein [Rhodoferax sp. TBRC 17199]MDT7516165.1 MucB/RseB C-terminal domain-containing protein [Rhodoferax sp. TBRC 17199]
MEIRTASVAKALLCSALMILSFMPAMAVAEESSVSAWLMRLHEASRHRTYTGTFVVSAGTQMASAKIWHVCDGDQQLERIESLSGTPRSTFRKNSDVLTLYPTAKVGIAETRDAFGLFPGLLKSQSAALDEFYQLKVLASDRVAGLEADVVQITPKDSMRYGYRVWSEKKSGLVVQLQTLDVDGRTLEQSAFSELQLDAPVSAAKLSQMMSQTEGYRLERRTTEKTTAATQGWAMSSMVPGFKSAGCYTRPVALLAGASGKAESTMQWMFSDGLATVSLFVERFDPARHTQVGVADLGGLHVPKPANPELGGSPALVKCPPPP